MKNDPKVNRLPAVFNTALTDDSSHIFIQFAGQDVAYLARLQWLYQSYHPIRHLVIRANDEIQRLMALPDVKRSGLYHSGFALLDWVQHPDKAPPQSYMASSAISQPLIFLTQVCEFSSVTTTAIPRATLQTLTKGYAGHSQGIMAAVLAALVCSDAEFEDHFAAMIRFFFMQGVRMQQSFPQASLPEATEKIAIDAGWGRPSPMLAISGVSIDHLGTVLASINSALPEGAHADLALVNGWKRLVISGHPQTLVQICQHLQGETQKGNRVQEHPALQLMFLSVTGPYHSRQMHTALAAFRKDLPAIGLDIKPSQFAGPVYATNDGRDLRHSTNLLEDLLQMQFLQSVDWNACTKNAVRANGVAHILDFGPGDGASTLTFLNREGEGVTVIPCGTKDGNQKVFAQTPLEKMTNREWASLAPTRTLNTITNAFTRFTDYPPIFGGGMTPTTVEEDIVIAATNDGFLLEWAGGGQVTEAILRERLDEITKRLKPGRGIIFNTLYLDAYLWNLHFPLLLKLKREGYPIDGVTISAGVPSREKAGEILQAFEAHGLWCNALKPGTDNQIQAALEIISDHPQMTIMLQIEGGKAGGHHSWNDLTGLLERHYHQIRRHPNALLCVGGGIGNPEQAWNLLNGTWHGSGKIMPVDAVFLGTRLMAAKEAKTSQQVKDLLVQTSGTNTWVEPAHFKGGMTSGQSSLGADIHYADNKAARVANTIDAVVQLGPDAILARKDELIDLIDQTAKPYFGDLAQMTYADVLNRMIALMAPARKLDAFFDITFRDRVFDFARLTVGRLRSLIANFDQIPMLHLQDPAVLDQPHAFMRQFLVHLPQAREYRVHTEDCDQFLVICRKPGKPVNFVPVIDRDLKRWYKSDSLWQSHDPLYPADQVLTIPGPAAVQGITRKDEPVAAIFRSFIEWGEKSDFQGPSVPGPNPTQVQLLVMVSGDANFLPSNWPTECGGPIRALLDQARIFDGQTKRANPLQAILIHGNDRQILIRTNEGVIASVELTIKDEVRVRVAHHDGKIDITYHHVDPTGEKHELVQTLQHHPTDPQCLFSYDHEVFRTAVNAFYRCLWLQETVPANTDDPWQTVTQSVAVDAKTLADYCEVALSRAMQNAKVPLSFAAVLLWQPLARCLLHPKLEIDLLRLLHLESEIKSLSRNGLRADATYRAEVRLRSRIQNDAGITIVIDSLLYDGDVAIVSTQNTFLVRTPSRLVSHEERYTEQRFLDVDPVLVHLLNKKPWLKETHTLKPGMNLRFDLKIERHRSHIQIVGDIVHNTQIIGSIAADSLAPIEFLDHYSETKSDLVPQKNGRSVTTNLTSPWSNDAYALASSDTNPIHTDEILAQLAGWQGRIVHGLWTSASTLSAIKPFWPEDTTYYYSKFSDTLPNHEAVNVTAKHTGNIDGEQEIQVTTQKASGAIVHQGRVRVRQPRTAYIFTGQGAQTQGMGMHAYETSPVARMVWDQADKVTREEFGFSLLHVVRNNPKTGFVNGKPIASPSGLLNLTQFAQVSLTVFAIAQIAELRAAGLFQEDGIFAGHSLGEYAALGAIGIVPAATMIRLTYNRGLVMQNFVPRDQRGRSPFEMIVVRPNLVGWDHQDLEREVAGVSHGEDKIYVVNYNVEGFQYSVTGHASALKKLIKRLEDKDARSAKHPPVWVHVPGVDVPFHSPFLLEGVDQFREELNHRITPDLRAERLVGRYIPNLNGTPFAIDHTSITALAAQTGSPVLNSILANWDATSKNSQQLSRTVLIELLAYQFASPVQWIETQNAIIENPLTWSDRVIEIGPSPVLSSLFKSTLKIKSETRPIGVFTLATDKALIFDQAPVQAVLTPKADVPVTIPAAAPTPTRSGNTTAITDRPFDTTRGLHSLLALKLNLRLDEVADTDTLEKLSAGNSARRNELLAEIAVEFGGASIDEGHLLPLKQLAQHFSDKSTYTAPGPFLTDRIERTLREKLVLSKEDLQTVLASEHALPPGFVARTLALVPLLVRPGESNRSGPLSSIGISARIDDASASRQWVGRLVDECARIEGISLAAHQPGTGSEDTGLSAAALAKWEEKYFGKKSPFHRFASDLLAMSDNKIARSSENWLGEKGRLDRYDAAFGKEFAQTITSLFDAKKHVSLTSMWNWGRSNLLQQFWNVFDTGNSIDRDVAERIGRQLDAEASPLVAYLQAKAKNAGKTRLVQSLQTIALHAGSGPLYRYSSTNTAPSVTVAEDGIIAYSEIDRGETPQQFLAKLVRESWADLPTSYAHALSQIVQDGIKLDDKIALVTGASPGAIAWEIAKSLLAAGARVVVTTSRLTSDRALSYRRLYQEYGAQGAELHVLPFNQGSDEDARSLVGWLFSKNLIPDFIFPFAAASDSGALSQMNPGSATTSLRVLLQGVQWIMSALVQNYRAIANRDRRTLLVLPLSPNHGEFGRDGAYGEAKLGLETLLNRWYSEHDDWGFQIDLVGARIGWVRGTGLMDANNLIAQDLERTEGVRTFSTAEMAFLLMAACHPDIAAESAFGPVQVELTGGFERIASLPAKAQAIRASLQKKSVLQKAVFTEEQRVQPKIPVLAVPQAKPLRQMMFPKIGVLNGSIPAIDPKEVVVVVGYGEVSPYGTSETRWQMETGILDSAGALELAWVMGLVHYSDKVSGWVDSKTNAPIDADDVLVRYGDAIRANTGIRLHDCNQQTFDPRKTTIWTDVVLQEPMSFSVPDAVQAQSFADNHGAKAQISAINGHWHVVLQAGSIIKAPRQLRLTRWVSGQLPTGWSAARFGLSKDLSDQVDPNTIYNFVATANAFDCAGIDVTNIAETIDPTRIANTQGGGMGGLRALGRMFHDVREDRERQGDVLQETLINVGPSWVNQAYVGGYGQTINPVGACATAIVSIAVGLDLLKLGKADFVVTGGYDDYSEESVVGFQDMAATCDTQDMLNRGIEPAHMSRPNDSRRGGFVEAQGGGTLLLARLDKALELGLPVYGVLAFADTRSDGIQTSIPAPGMGLASIARDDGLKSALAQFHCTGDDISVVSKHDTSTQANDLNENRLHQVIQDMLGRTPGNPLYVHSQKCVLGHAKGGAGAWQSIAALQMLQSGLVPGNRNLENVDPAMRRFDTLSFHDRTLQLSKGAVRGVLVTSLGFGHVGAAALFLHPDFALQGLDSRVLDDYCAKRKVREERARKRSERVLAGKEPLFTRRTQALAATAELQRLTRTVEGGE